MKTPGRFLSGGRYQGKGLAFLNVSAFRNLKLTMFAVFRTQRCYRSMRDPCVHESSRVQDDGHHAKNSNVKNLFTDEMFIEQSPEGKEFGRVCQAL